MQLAEWARQQGMRAVISSAFESSLGIAQLAQLAAAVDAGAGAGAAAGEAAAAAGGGAASKSAGEAGAGTWYHGLATLDWFAGGLLPEAVEQGLMADGSISLRAAQAVVEGALSLGQHPAAAGLAALTPRLAQQRCAVRTAAGTYEFRLLDSHPASFNSSNGSSPAQTTAPPMVFLHGFLGSAEDWRPLMAALSTTHRCLALDLPGHGSARVQPSPIGTTASRSELGGSSSTNGSGSGSGAAGVSVAAPAAYSLEAAAAAVANLVQQQGLQGCTLVGYSLGGRLALLLAARWPRLFGRVVVVSGTPGVEDPQARVERAARDEALAAALRRGGARQFVADWYRQPMWASLRAHPCFHGLLAQRGAVGDAPELAAALAAMSPGRAPSLWGELYALALDGTLPELVMVAGERDAKFAAVARRAVQELHAAGGSGAVCWDVVVPGAGHAVHLERPLELLELLSSLGSRV